MPRPPEGYRCADGMPVPGVGDPNGRFANLRPIIPWARNQGFAQALRGLSKPDHYDRTDLDIGTVTMGMIEQHLRGQDPALIDACAVAKLSEPEHLAAAGRAFNAFKIWAKSVQLEVVALELPLVSEKYRYGGTLDIAARVTIRIRGRVRRILVLIDVKTSRSGNVYSEHLVQLAAYRQLWEENGKQKIQGFFVLICPKDGSPVKPFFYEQLREQFRLFLLFRDAYDIDKAISTPQALAGTPIALPPPPAPPKPQRDMLMLNGRARHARFLPHRAALVFSHYEIRTSIQFELPHELSVRTRAVVAGAARASTAPCSVAEPAAAPVDLDIPEFLRRTGDGWASFKKATAP